MKLKENISVIGALEFNSIAVGTRAMDEIVKAAPVQIVEADIINPGKFFILFTGDVASVDASLSRGKTVGGGYLVDELFIPRLHRQIIPAINRTVVCNRWDAAGIIECFSLIASIEAGDIAAKTTGVMITEIRLSSDMGGKSFVKMMGDVHEVEAAVSAGAEYITQKGLLCTRVIIPKPHPDIRPFY